jgi:hypothetical protein
MKGNSKERPFIHQEKKGDKQKDIQDEFNCYFFHDHISSGFKGV